MLNYDKMVGKELNTRQFLEKRMEEKHQLW